MSIHNRSEATIVVGVHDIKGRPLDTLVIAPDEIKPIKYSSTNTLCVSTSTSKATIASDANISYLNTFLDVVGEPLPEICLNITEDNSCRLYYITIAIILILIFLIIFIFRKKIF